MWNASWFEGMWTVKDFVWEKSLLCRLLLYVPMFWAPLSCVLSCFYMTRVCSLISKFCCHRLYWTGYLEMALGSSAFVLNNATTVPLLFNRELWFSWNEILLTLLETLGLRDSISCSIFWRPILAPFVFQRLSLIRAFFGWSLFVQEFLDVWKFYLLGKNIFWWYVCGWSCGPRLSRIRELYVARWGLFWWQWHTYKPEMPCELYCTS